ncbi:hypothetical protein TNCV_1774871 [Trichonephila clavipes]|nr:hypothetical protein TNCV_1774871 [Trichonephila clavipes]
MVSICVLERNLDSHGSLVVKVMDFSQEFELRTVEHPPCRGGQCMPKMSRALLKSSPIGVMWKLGEEGCQLRCRPRHLTKVQNYQGPSSNALE